MSNTIGKTPTPWIAAHPNMQAAKKDIQIQLKAHAVFQKTEFKTDDHPPPLKLKIESPDAKGDLTQGIENSVQNTRYLKKVGESAEKAQTTQTISEIVQYIVSDIVLRGGAFTALSGLPILLDSSTEVIEFVKPASENLELFTDLFDFGAGMACLIYKMEVLDHAKMELEKLKTSDQKLTSPQRARLEKLEKIVFYERKLLIHEQIEQGIRTVKSAVSYGSIIVTKVTDSPVVQVVASVVNVVIAGLVAVLYGHFFSAPIKILKLITPGQTISKHG